MGFSPKHLTLMGLTLNIRTQSITPQFHVVFDDTFSSVHSNEEDLETILDALYPIPGSRLKVHLDYDTDSSLNEEWLTQEESDTRSNAERQKILRSSVPSQAPSTDDNLHARQEESTSNSQLVERFDSSTLSDPSPVPKIESEGQPMPLDTNV